MLCQPLYSKVVQLHTCVCSVTSVMSKSLRPYWPSRLLCPWDSLGKNTGVDCPAFLQGIFPSQGLNPNLLCLQHCRQSLHCWANWETPYTYTHSSITTILVSLTIILASLSFLELFLLIDFFLTYCELFQTWCYDLYWGIYIWYLSPFWYRAPKTLEIS